MPPLTPIEFMPAVYLLAKALVFSALALLLVSCSAAFARRRW